MDARKVAIAVGIVVVLGGGYLLLRGRPGPPEPRPTRTPTPRVTVSTSTRTEVPSATLTPTVVPDTPTATLVPTSTGTSTASPNPTATNTPSATPSSTLAPSATATRPATSTATRTASATLTATQAATATVTKTATPFPTSTRTATPAQSPTPMPTPVGGGPVHGDPWVGIDTDLINPNLPACLHTAAATDQQTHWHALVGYENGVLCHFDHEHGQNVDTPYWRALFGGLEYTDYTGQEISYPWETPNENLIKHGGYKIIAYDKRAFGCVRRNPSDGVIEAYIMQFHARSDQADARAHVHSGMLLVRVCDPDNPGGDPGFGFFSGWQQFGQIVAPYQGGPNDVILNLPGQPQPPYDPAREPYLGHECIGDSDTTCHNFDQAKKTASATWVSEGVNIPSHALFTYQLDSRDLYDGILASTRLTTPEFRYFCSQDGGFTYDPVNCRNNGSTFRPTGIKINIPAAWDGATFDSDPRPGRVTAELWTDRFGALVEGCVIQDLDCVPLILRSMFVGFTGMGLPKLDDDSIAQLPERDVMFCGNVFCAEGSPGGVWAGWIGAGN